MLNKKLDLNLKFFDRNVSKKSTREAYGDGIVKAAFLDPDIIALCGDLIESTKLEKFSTTFPDRFIEVGIAEQNMAGIAAGLANSGKIPFISSFATFSPGRNWEQIRVSVCYSEANVKIASTHAGLSQSWDGPTAQALEDIAITRVLPHLIVINPIDYEQAFTATLEAARHKGPVYLRFERNPTPEITTNLTPFVIGKGLHLTEGSDLSVFTTGTITSNVLQAEKFLKDNHKMRADVIAFPTIKPLDHKAIISSARKTGRVVTVEEHQVNGGFGSAVCEVLSQNFPVKTKIIGVEDTFAESGDYEEIMDKYGLSTNKIGKSILKFINE